MYGDGSMYILCVADSCLVGLLTELFQIQTCFKSMSKGIWAFVKEESVAVGIGGR